MRTSSSSSFDNFIHQLYEAATEPDQWEPCLEQLADLLHADSIGLTVHSHQSNCGSMALMARFDPALQKEYDTYYSGVNVWKNRFAQQYRQGVVLNSAELCTGSELERTEWYNDFLRRAGVYHSMGAVLERTGSTTSVVTVLRAKEKGQFSWEQELLARISPHFTRAIRIHRVLADSSAREQALEAQPVAVFVLDINLRIRFQNSRAESLLSEALGLSQRNGQLDATIPSSQARLLSALANAVKAITEPKIAREVGTYFTIDRAIGQAPLQAFATPARLTHSFLPGAPAVLLYIKDPSAVKSDPTRLKKLFGFTTQEARIAAHLAQGGDLRATAKHLHISYETARKHLSNLQGKAGATRQSDLLRLIINGISLTGLQSNETDRHGLPQNRSR